MRAEKGHDGNASCCRGKRNFLRASRQSPSMPSVRAASQVTGHRTGVARLNIFRPCCWIANLHKSDAFKPNHVAFTKYFP